MSLPHTRTKAARPAGYALTAAACYALWGAIHVWVGSKVLARAQGPSPEAALAFLVDARPQTTPGEVGPAVAALTEQHGWNLLWLGGTVAALAWRIARNRTPAMLWASAIAGFADLGYLAAFVAPGLVKLSTWIGGPTLWLAGGLFSWLAARRPDLPAKPKDSILQSS